MSRVILFPYKMNSTGCRNLQDALEAMGHNTLRVYPDGKYKPRKSDITINWGNSSAPMWDHKVGLHFCNYPTYVDTAIRKDKAFSYFAANKISCPVFTTSKDEAKNMLAQGIMVLARTKLTGKRGQGIVVMQQPQDFVDAPLYVQYKKKKKEFRVHVFNGKVISLQEKRKRKNGKESNPLIRSEENNWVFCRENVIAPEGIHDLAIKAVKCLGLDFGGVDVIWNEKENKCYVLEVNTAPGIEGTTVTDYATAISSYIQKVSA